MRWISAALVGLALGLGGCSLGDGDEPLAPKAGDSGGAPEAAKPRKGEPGEAEAIRAWSLALNEEDYQQAASFFAEGAIVQQTSEIRLRDRGAAVAFNRSLPCKADVTDVTDEGDTVLAAFRLRGGPAGGCDGGTARVRFTFEDGKFSEWRQLTEPPPAQGDIA